MYQEWKKLAPSFEPPELLSPKGMSYFDRGHAVITPSFMLHLQGFRNHMASPFFVNHGESKLRGYRGAYEAIGVSFGPYHMMGVAADVTVPNVDVEVVAKEAKKFGFRGIGIYDTFTHIDLRPRLVDKVFEWDNRTQNA